MKIRKFFLITLSFLLCSELLLTSCGKKGPLEYPYEKKRPVFDKTSDEM